MQATRRDVLAHGGKAIAVAAALPFIPAINPAQAQEDAELFAQSEKCRQLEIEYMAAINRHDDVWLPIRQQFPRYLDGVKPEGLAEAEKQAGVPALAKKQDAVCDDWLAALDRFYDMPAHTFEGMILKLTNEWTDSMWRAWRAKDVSEHFEFHPAAAPSVVMDLERLSGRVV